MNQNFQQLEGQTKIFNEREEKQNFFDGKEEQNKVFL